MQKEVIAAKKWQWGTWQTKARSQKPLEQVVSKQAWRSAWKHVTYVLKTPLKIWSENFEWIGDLMLYKWELKSQ